MTITKTIVYTCCDGKEFYDIKLAEQHEAEIKRKTENLYDEWIRTSYGAKRLFEKHSLSETGVWRIRGEDPNPDFGGHHYQPELGTVEGKLEAVILYAVNLPGFYTWGGGGTIEKVEIKPVYLISMKT